MRQPSPQHLLWFCAKHLSAWKSDFVPGRLNLRGTWPGPIALRRGWALATARPWNDESTDAHLRLIRGSAEFLEAAAAAIPVGHGTVLSPPLAAGSTTIWEEAGFRPHLVLDMFQRDLLARATPPTVPVMSGEEGEWDHAIQIDRAAFDPLWRLGATGLKEALNATPTSEFLTVRGETGTIVGFAIVGAGAAIGYLQRVAVDPAFARQGYGRALVRASLGWARQHGCRTMLLNTQPENEPAGRLYESEGFTRVAAGLVIWSRDGRQEP
jgi:ribosomal protein S18 acetylase RimI-like enzyme